MKSALDMITEFERMNIKLWTDGDQLRYRGPSDVLTPDVLKTLTQMKPFLMQILKNDCRRPPGVLFEQSNHHFSRGCEGPNGAGKS